MLAALVPEDCRETVPLLDPGGRLTSRRVYSREDWSISTTRLLSGPPSIMESVERGLVRGIGMDWAEEILTLPWEKLTKGWLSNSVSITGLSKSRR